MKVLSWNVSGLRRSQTVHNKECDAVWCFTGFYGNPEERSRSESWDLLRRLGQEQIFPLVVLGDFNKIAHSFEKKGSRLRAERQMDDFRTVLDECDFNDLGYIGKWFTWERGRFLSTNIRERLDRGVATLNWVNLCPSYQLDNLNDFFSDHYLILLDTVGKQMDFSYYEESSFRFEAKWCLNGSFEDEIRKN
ncbi:hypothetical protein PVK06_043747 [Gossypium arboreum]|uniref:Reverse transcriptase n=1 Tax=Gossypium arboreum TaxID=29729 RepID=A0ABR0MR31_GOSAR|nr:hypothetical protein PVK06_043747 [Gossypium arboreum]